MKRQILTILSVLLGIALFVGVILSVGIDETLHALARTGIWGVIVFLFLGVLQILFLTLTWRVLMKDAGYYPSFLQSFICMLIGYTGNMLTPSMHIGGEPLAAYAMSEKEGYPTRDIMGTMITCKFLQLLSFLLFFFFGSIAFFIEFTDTLSIWLTRALVAANAGVILLAGGLLFLFIKGYYVMTAICRQLARFYIFPRTLLRLKPKVRGMEKTVHNAFQRSWRGSLLAFFYSFGAMISIFLRPILFFEFVPEVERIGVMMGGVFFTLTQLIQVLQFTPGGLGIFDGGTVLIFDYIMDISKSMAMSFNINYRVADTGLVALGAMFLLQFGAFSLLMEKDQLKENITEDIT